MRSTLVASALVAVTLSALVVASSGHPLWPATPARILPALPGEPGPLANTAPPRLKRPAPERVVDGPPLSLTASDGSGLTLASLRANAVVEGPLAFTELRLSFDNPEDRVREGTFKIVLPQGASVGRLAMKIDGVWQEGEIVKKERARVAYEDALHHKQDPALMERGAGNELTARVFPIPARGRKEILVSYAQELTADAPYALPLRGLPELGELDVSVAGIDGAPQTMHRERYTPPEDFVADGSGPPVAALRSGDLVVARVRPVPEAMPDPVTNAVVLIDTSASRALGLASELRAVREVLAGLEDRAGAKVTVSVAAFDQEIARVYQGDARGFGDAEIDRVTARRALGASNLERALQWAGDEAKATKATRVILVTDGVATAGEEDGAKLARVAASLKDDGAARLDVVAVGGIRNDALAHTLTTAGLAHDGVVADASLGAAAIVRRLESGTKSDVVVAVEGSTWSYPARLDGVQPGDEALVYAEVPEGSPVRVRVGGAPAVALDASTGDRPLLERACAEARIAGLEAEEREHGTSADLEQRIVDLSVKHRVLSAYTSLLVLEGESDYARFGIDRRALSDVLAVEGGHLTWTKRSDAGGSPFPAKESRELDRQAPPAHHMQPKISHRFTETASAPAFDALDSTGSAAAPPADDLSEAPSARAQADEGSMGNGAASAATAPARLEEPRTAPAPAAPLSASPAPIAARDDEAAPQVLAAFGSGGAGGGVVGHLGAAHQSRPSGAASGRVSAAGERDGVDPYTGPMKQVKERLAAHDAGGALTIASRWEASAPGDVLALVALGEASEATSDVSTASRAYGSILDLFPSRADLRRFAGERLEHIQGGAALDLAIDTFDKARRDRPDHPESHRLAAYARVRRGEYAAAFDILEAGAARTYPEGRFLGVDRILREDLGLVAAAWIRAVPSKKSEILARLARAGGTIEDAPSIRFVLNWETDANDVDFHIEDAEGGHAFYGSPHLPSGGDLYADVTTGYGPECFTIRAPKGKRAAPYTLRAHYYSRGPMGYGMGKLEIIDHDGHGGLSFEERPFVVMADHAFVDLGTVRR